MQLLGTQSKLLGAHFQRCLWRHPGRYELSVSHACAPVATNRLGGSIHRERRIHLRYLERERSWRRPPVQPDFG